MYVGAGNVLKPKNAQMLIYGSFHFIQINLNDLLLKAYCVLCQTLPQFIQIHHKKKKMLSFFHEHCYNKLEKNVFIHITVRRKNVRRGLS